MNHLMIDLETLGTSNYCPVISIGAVFFDKSGLGEQFYTVLNVEEQISGPREVDGGTIKWWMQQENAAQTVFKDTAIPTKKALSDFVKFIKANCKTKDIKPWGNGSNFDIEILESILKDYDLEVPWKFWNIRDLRTFKEFVDNGEGVPREGTYHNALDDAITQANVVIRGMSK